jgi:hypothetical protein
VLEDANVITLHPALLPQYGDDDNDFGLACEMLTTGDDDVLARWDSSLDGVENDLDPQRGIANLEPGSPIRMTCPAMLVLDGLILFAGTRPPSVSRPFRIYAPKTPGASCCLSHSVG